MIAIYVVAGVVVVALLAGVASYNRFARQRNLVRESWGQVDVELVRRHDLIPNLVETVKGYAAHEQAVLERVSQLRNVADAPGSGVAEQARQETALSGGLSQLFAVAEAYPDLKANQNFLELQRQLAETEDRIAAARRFYNGNVRALNTRVEAFPSSVMAAWMKITKAEYFELAEGARATPQVDLGG